jgi:hypothetical protein
VGYVLNINLLLEHLFLDLPVSLARAKYSLSISLLHATTPDSSQLVRDLLFMSFVSKIKKVMMNQETPEWKSKPKYQDLAENTDDEEQSNPCLEKGVDDLSPQHLERRPWSKVFAVFPWLLTLIFVSTTAFHYKGKECSMPGHGNLGCFEQGYASAFFQ